MAIWALLARLFDGAWLLLSHVSGRNGFPQPLGKEREREMVARLGEGDEEAKRILIEHNLRLVAHIAKKYARSGLDADDLVSIGSIGLIKAVSSFRPESGRLATYASRCVENEILMALRASRKLRANLSLNEAIGSDREGNEIHLLDVLGTDVELVANEAETHIESGRALRLMNSALDERERAVLSLRYGLTDGSARAQHEVAEALGISRSYVSRIEKKALSKLREAFERAP